MTDWRDEIKRRLAELGLGPAREWEIVEEWAQHLEDRYEQLRDGGASEEEAVRAALGELRDSELLARELRQFERPETPEPVVPGATRRGSMIGDLWQDLRYGTRMLIRNPGFTVAAALSLALGIGANTAIFSLIDVVLLKMLPVERPGQLYFINNVGARGGGGAPPYPCYERFRDQTRYFSGIAAFSPDDPRLDIDGQVEQVKGQFVSGNYFELLGVTTVIGRPIGPADDAAAVISHGYWRRRFGLSPEVIGRVIRVGRTPVTVVGVTPPEFSGLAPGREVEITLPIALAGMSLTDTGSWWFEAVGRLKDGASVEQARAELDAIFQAFMGETPTSRDMRRDFFDHIELEAAGQGLGGLRTQYAKPLLVLMAVAGLVLLISCANVANLLLARATARRRELAVRMALGASRARLVRQMLTESLLLIGLGGLPGLLLARWSGALLVTFFATGRRQIFLDLRLDGRLLLFTLGLGLLTGVIFGLAPALRATRVDPGTGLKENAAAAAGDRGGRRLGKLLVVTQTALSLVLLVGAGLFLRSLQNLRGLDPGFRPHGVLTLRLDLGARDYQRAQQIGFWREALARARALPGVDSASLSALSPLDGRDRGVMIDVPGFTPVAERDKAVSLNHVSPEYFATMGIAVRHGRPFGEQDHESAPKVALLTETAARFYFGDRDPVGARIRLSRPRSLPAVEVVGVVNDARYRGLREQAPRLLYLPLPQSIDPAARLTLALRTPGDPAALVKLAREEMRALGADILVTDVITLEDQVNQTLLQERLVSLLSGVFGLLALLLACVGLYGVMSYDVARRRHEIGIRLALGAGRGDVMRLVLRESMLLVAIGVGVGLAAALATTRVIASLLYGLAPADALTIISAALLMAAVAAAAAYLPARRASRVDPVKALRPE